MPDTSFVALLLRLAVSLGVVLLLMWGAARLMGRGPRAGGRRTGGVEMLARQTLGRRSSVAVLRVGSKAFLVGVTDTSVSVLAEVDPGEATVAVDDTSSRPPTIAQFVEQLRERTVRKRQP
jgi:flagellar protein FliO/FliZ